MIYNRNTRNGAWESSARPVLGGKGQKYPRNKNIRMHGSDEGFQPEHEKTKMAPVVV